MPEFHFLRPWWLAMLPLGCWLCWRLARAGGMAGRWRGLVDKALQPFVLAGTGASLHERQPVLIVGIAAWALATLALAGPTWERLPVPAMRSDEALVVLLDLSRSMDAADIEPTRLARAKLKLLGLLERRRSGQTGLIVFSAHAFTVAPLTTDTRNIASLVASLSTDIMPSRGSYPEAGLRKGVQLLRQTGLDRGELLLISDAEASTGAEDAVVELRDAGYVLHVLAVGTEHGAPISLDGGGFLTDREGRVVVPQLDVRGLRRLANLGGGRFATLTADDSDLDTILGTHDAPAGQALGDGDDSQRRETDLWQDEGMWLTLLLLPLVAMSFRRGWVVVLAVGFALPAPRAEALEWADLWLRNDQQGERAFAAQEHGRAATLFEDAGWRSAALYRSGDFEGSAEALADLDTADAHYNRGNALARDGRLQQAIEAYSRALELDPGHEDARFNRELLLQQEPPPQSQDQQQGDPQQQQSDDSQQNDDQQSAANQPSDSERSESMEPTNPEDAEQSSTAETASDGDERKPSEPEEFEPLPSPGELEEWASEQAADQWLRRIPENPGGLLRRKFQFQYQRLGQDQDGNFIWPGDEEQPW